MKKVNILFLLLVMIISCSEDNSSIETNEDVLWTELASSDFDYLGVAETGELMAIEMNETNSKPFKLYYKNEDKSDFMLWLNEEGLPSEAYVNGYYLVFRNISETSLDIGIINKAGETEIIRNINYDFRELINTINSNSLKSTNVEWGTVIKWSGHALNAGMCIASVAGAVSSFGILAPVGALTCSSFILGMASEAAGALIDNETFDNTLLAYSGMGGFSSIGDVLVLIGNLMLNAEDDKDNNYETIEEVIDDLDESSNSYIKYDDFGVTELVYEDNSNWEQIVEEIFGLD